MDFSDLPLDGDDVPPVKVHCAGAVHTLVAVDTPGEFDIRCANHHDGSLVVTLLGGTKTQCHRTRDDIKMTAARCSIPLREAMEWYAYEFTWTTMQAWHRHGGPKVAAGWARAGVTPSQVRILYGLGVTNVNDYLVWQQACQYGAKMDLNVIREYIVDHGVTSAAEALAWRRAGLQRPAQLSTLRARGVTTPEKLRARRAKDRRLVGAAGEA